MVTKGLVWFRRDLRLDDHAALAAAAEQCERIVAVFVLDPVQLGGEQIGPPNVSFFFESLGALRAELRAAGSELAVLRGDFAVELERFARASGAHKLFYNVDYGPAAVERDARVDARFARTGLSTESFVDHVYFSSDAIRKEDGGAYTVFTPYKRRWLERHALAPQPIYPSRRTARPKWVAAAEVGDTLAIPTPAELGFAPSDNYPKGGSAQAERMLELFLNERIGGYDEARNVPQRNATSRLSPHLRAGTIAIRTCVDAALEARSHGARERGVDVWLSELIWRDFYAAILSNFPRVATGPFLPSGAAIPWRSDETGFEAWTQARTGYPIVDAAMRQLIGTGWMHNRLRMIVASFLTKDLLVDWRRGERFFEQWLADADLASNNGGWQWAASTGTDAAPYFRVFNPVLQSQKFDPDGAFIAAMLPELAGLPGEFRHAPWTAPPLILLESNVRLGESYPRPIVDHATARERALAALSPILGKKR